MPFEFSVHQSEHFVVLYVFPWALLLTFDLASTFLHFHVSYHALLAFSIYANKNPNTVVIEI